MIQIQAGFKKETKKLFLSKKKKKSLNHQNPKSSNKLLIKWNIMKLNTTRIDKL